MKRRGITYFCVLMSALSVTGAFAQGPSSDAFDSTERARLASGRLVARPTSADRRGLHLLGGTSFQVINRSPEVTWNVLTRESSYRYILPAVEEAHTVDRSPGQRIVRISHGYGLLRANYHLRIDYDHEEHDISFQLDPARDNDIEAAWGFLSITRYQGDDNKSLVSWGIMADVGQSMLSQVFSGEVHDWMLRVPTTFRTHVHRRF